MNIGMWAALGTSVLAVGLWLHYTSFRLGRMFSPISLITLMLLAIFGIRPILMSSDAAGESFYFYGYYVDAGYALASVLGLVATLALATGVLVSRSTRINRAQAASDDAPEDPIPGSFRLHPKAIRRSYFCALLLTLLWVFVMATVGGGLSFVLSMFGGRSPEIRARLENVPALVSLMPVIGALILATVRFCAEKARAYSSAASVAYLAVGALTIIPPMALGTRRFLIPCVVMLALGAMRRIYSRLVRPAWVVGAVVAALFLVALPFVRSSGSRRSDSDLAGAMGTFFSDQGIGGALRKFFLSYDTEMFNWVAHYAPQMGSSIPFGLGRGSFLDILVQVLPAGVLGRSSWNGELLTLSFGQPCAVESACPVPSIVGVLYTDLGPLGLTLGLFLLGLLGARFESRLFASGPLMVAALFLCAGFALGFARGNSMNQVVFGMEAWVIFALLSPLFAKRLPHTHSGEPDYMPTSKRYGVMSP